VALPSACCPQIRREDLGPLEELDGFLLKTAFVPEAGKPFHEQGHQPGSGIIGLLNQADDTHIKLLYRLNIKIVDSLPLHTSCSTSAASLKMAILLFKRGMVSSVADRKKCSQR
jgi:hypothetical protein